MPPCIQPRLIDDTIQASGVQNRATCQKAATGNCKRVPGLKVDIVKEATLI